LKSKEELKRESLGLVARS